MRELPNYPQANFEVSVIFPWSKEPNRQKARCKWEIEGDENSAFFHGSLKANLKHNRISGLNIDGRWETDPGIIKNEVWSYFKNKFKETHPIRPRIRSNKFKRLSQGDSHTLELPLSREEIKRAVWSCGNDKAPGPDGFNFRFIKRFWNTVEDDIVEAVKFFEEHKIINPESNTSFITLVPKNSDPQSLKEFRPINLIGCLTKIISKALASHLKPFLDSIISPKQPLSGTGT